MNTEMLLVEIPSKKSSYNLEFDYSQPLMLTGQLLKGEDDENGKDKTFPHSQKFTLNGVVINVPGLSDKNDAKLRTFATLQQVVRAMFKDLDAEEEASEETPQFIMVQALKDAGYPISHFSKAAVCESIRIFKEMKSKAVESQVTSTRVLFVEKLIRIAKYNETIKTNKAFIKGRLQIGR